MEAKPKNTNLPPFSFLLWYSPTRKDIDIHDVYLLTGWGMGLLWRAWSRRKLPRRCTSWDDGPKCDWMCWWFTNYYIQRPELPLSHPLWPKAQRLSISRACLHYCREAPKKAAWTTTLFQSLNASQCIELPFIIDERFQTTSLSGFLEACFFVCQPLVKFYLLVNRSCFYVCQ